MYSIYFVRYLSSVSLKGDILTWVATVTLEIHYFVEIDDIFMAMVDV